MKILIHTALILVAAGLGLALGFVWRGKPPTGSDSVGNIIATSSSTVFQTNLLPTVQRLTIVATRDDSPLATQLERDLSMSSGVTRWLYWLEAIEKATSSDFPRLARLSQGNVTATKLLAARWVVVAPRHLFDTLVAAKDGRGFPASELATVLFDEWPKRDPDAVIAALSETNHPGINRDWRWTVAYNLIGKDMERGLRLISEWNVNDVGFGSSGLAAVAKWSRANPRHAAEFILEQPDGHSVRSTMETIGKEWARSDPVRAMEFAATKLGERGETLAGSILKNWAGQSLHEAADWLAGTDASTRNRLSSAFVEAWAKHDAGGAMAWCEANLTGSSLAQAVGGVSKGAAASDVVGAAGLVTDMKPSAARAEAALGVALNWFPESFSGKRVPPEAIEWLKSLDAGSVKHVLNHQIHFRWADVDPKSFAAFLASAESTEIPDHIYSSLARNMARQNPIETLEWASRLPDGNGLSAGSQAFSEWRRAQPEAATKWLNELPAADARREHFFENAIQNLAYEPQAAEQLAALSTDERAAARSIIAKMSIPEDRRARLIDALGSR